MSQKKNFVKKGHIYRSLVASALIANGVFQFIAPVLAEGTSGGETIDNTATATYEDPNNPGETINATSNTVQVTVAEIAGITVTASGTDFVDGVDGDGNPLGDADGNEKISVGDKLYYNYTVTNVGNDPTKFRIPDQPTITGQGSLTQLGAPGDLKGPVEISYDGGTTWENVDAGGTTTTPINPDQSVLVRVAVEVEPGAQPGEKIAVQLGDTPGDEQNIPRDSDGGDVFTIDNGDGDGVDGEVPGVPANGTREASATQEVTVDEELKTYTLAKVLKVRTDHTVAGDDGPKDDTVTYELSLEVENTDPTGNGISPAPLEGIEVPGISADADDKRILVSDAIPEGTQLESVEAPSGWTVVYVNDLSQKANQATWTATEPTGAALANVRRVGFVRTGTIAPGGPKLEGFKITVKVNTPVEENTVQIRNVAQLFGTSPSGAPVYDESGDNNPSNYNDEGQPPAGTDTGDDPDGIPDILPDSAVDDGLITTADLTDFGTDTQNNNSGEGAGGEANVFTITKLGAVSLLNGPEGKPEAVAEDDNNKDFTNKSSLVPADSRPGVPINPDGVSFTNTVLNTGQDPDPDNDADGNGEADIVLLPIAPGGPLSPGNTENVVGETTDLPNNTVVTLSYLEQKATYIYADGNFTLDSGEEITIPDVPAGETRNYGVEVNLPEGTNLSTDEGVERGYPVPIRAYIDNNDDGVADTEDGTPGGVPAQNVTIDRVYVGYLQMVKETRVIKADGPDVLDGEDQFSKEKKNPAPGNTLEYRITYKNISEPQSGTDNVTLNASDIVITEDGTLSTAEGDGKNNWALDNDSNGEIDTSNITGSATDSGGANIEFTPGADQTGTTPDTDVTKYGVVVGDDVEPQETRTFTFQRRINGGGLTGDANTAPAPAPAPEPAPDPAD